MFIVTEYAALNAAFIKSVTSSITVPALSFNLLCTYKQVKIHKT